MSTMDESSFLASTLAPFAPFSLQPEEGASPSATATVTELGHELERVLAVALFGGVRAGSAEEDRRRLIPILILAISLLLHGVLAVSLSRLPADELRPFRPRSHVRVTVTRPPEPIKPLPVPPEVIEPPKHVPPPIARKRLEPAPQPVHTSEPPPPAEPVLAKTEAVDPGAVIGSIEGSVTGTGVVGGIKGGTGEVLAPPPPPPPAPIVQAHEGAGYLRNPRPPYPDLAQRRGWEGEVLLRVRVSPAGKVEEAVLRRSSGRGVLDEAALAAVRGWTFVPARRGTTPIAGSVEVPIVFKLQ
jgi:periplasmic protein TonB